MDALQNTHYNKEVGSLILNNSNRNEKGQVDLEKVAGVKGVVLANQVINPTDVVAGGSKKVRSLPPKKDVNGKDYSCATTDCYLNLYRKTTHGQSFGKASAATSPAAAGLVIGIGKRGPLSAHPRQWRHVHLARCWRNWKEMHKSPHKWAIGDHGGPTETILYSYDYGTTWSEVSISSQPVLVHSILTLPDSTSLKFLVMGVSESDKNDFKMTIYGLDFDNTLPRKCDKPSSKSSDFRDRCFLGKKTKFLRRKEDANCLIGKEFEDLAQDNSDCQCTKDDYEWYKECTLLSVDPLQPATCKLERNPALSCKEEKILRKKLSVFVGSHKGTLGSWSVFHNVQRQVDDYFYFNRTKTAVILDAYGQVWVSTDAGVKWERPDLMKGEKSFTEDNGNSFHTFDTPSPPNIGYLIYTGQSDCGSSDDNCHAVSYVTKDNGRSWSEIRKYSEKCVWGKDKFFRPLKEEIFCRAFENQKGNQRHMDRKDHPALFLSKDFGKNWERVFKEVVGFAISYEYMVVALVRGDDDKPEARLMVTLDGVNWKEAEFQDNSRVVNSGYTLLESGTGAIFLEVFTSRKRDEEYGVLYKSNAAGVDFEIVIKIYTDFEKALGIEGSPSPTLRLKTFITFNDGDRWQSLSPPDHDVNGKSYNCDGNAHKNDLFTSKSAVGLMVGVGNYTDGDVFLTRDAGRTWKEIAKEAHMIEIGDRGGVIVLVNDEEPTDEVKYTLDQGVTVRSIRVTNIISEPYGSTSSFVVFGTIKGGNRMDPLDFEVWSPTGQATGDEKCIFGEQRNYYRRKATRHCKIGDFNETPQVVNKACACTADDFECDVGFVKNTTGHCSWSSTTSAIPAPTCENGLKKFTTGYRKHKRTKCQGGLSLDKGATEYCAAKISAFGWIGIIMLSVGIPAAVTYAIVWNYRGGRIRLPVDSASQGAPTHWAERIGRGLRVALVFGTEVAEALYDWVRMRSNRHAGYSPVRNVATALDEEIDNDPALLDLDDY
ncbi:hypothetical protein BC829DRAFT_395110 [Chytridium lagenaria]|nr:hypothetical protein BC829DRAFT_395110 [Chytridium lagenaria]